ncbi:MAG: flagellar hook-basal body complex protein FliE [Gemmatimonadales bacterium]|nr:flagellar hook-basal body complex protein FliE [Gemmatimonadales bacterium]
MTTPIRPDSALRGRTISPLERGFELRSPGATAPEGAPDFGALLKKGVGEVQQLQDTSADYVQRFLRGEPVELHQVMAAGEEAGIALDLLVELRNKFMEAYKTIMNVQV